MPKRTPLYAAHIASAATLVEFAGWEMPLHYGSQIEEHHRVRRDAGVFDVSHMLALDVAGAGARAFLRHALANDVAKLDRPGRAQYSCLLNQAGGILDDLIAYSTGADAYRIVVNAGRADKDVAWLESLQRAAAPGPSITPRRDLCMLAVQGPNARRRVWQALPETAPGSADLARFEAAPYGAYFVARTGYTGEDGFELAFDSALSGTTWSALIEAGVAPCGLGARDTLRLEAGMNLYGQDMDESVMPAESNLAWTVDLSGPRDFVGRQAIEAARPRRHLVGLVLLDRGVMRSHQRVITARGEGAITSGGYAPTLSRSIALARVPAAVAPGDTVRVEMRARLLEARVVRPPFVRNGRSLIPAIEEPR